MVFLSGEILFPFIMIYEKSEIFVKDMYKTISYIKD